MTRYASPECLINYAPAAGGHPIHPMIQPTVEWPVNLMPVNPVELIPNGGTDIYTVRFRSVILNPTRIYAVGFTTDPTHPLWTNCSIVTTNDTTVFHNLNFTAADLHGSSQIWLGSWFDDGTYPPNQAGILAYFHAHPNSPGHHTVPVIITS
jgi:hypothetical protein